VADTDKGFHPDDFYNAIAKTVASRKVTWKQVSKETQVSSSTLTRMAQGRQPDAASLAALSAWAGINPADFVKSPRKNPAQESLVGVSALLRADPNLNPKAVQALEAIFHAAYETLKKDGKNKK
jgi:transcriptional regulator with XRE-family HTH domain